MSDITETQTAKQFVFVTEFSNNVAKENQLIISDKMHEQINIYLYVVAIGVMAIFGTFSNVCNMTVFYSLGIKDSMSVCLFSLSITDFFLSSLILISRSCTIWNIFYDNQGIDPFALLYAGPSFVADILFLCSGWIVTFLSLERCVCVTFPFKVKTVFTRNRSITAIITIYVINVVSHIPIFMTQRLGWITKDGPGNNDSKTPSIQHLVVLFTENRPDVQAYVGIFNSAFITMPSLALTLGSVLWMIYALNVSTKLRETMTSSNTHNNEKDKQDLRVTRKTRKLVKVVLFLAIIFTICSIPRTIAKFIYVIFPAMTEGGSESNLNRVMWQGARLAACINASVNIFVYLKINTSYQAKFREIFLTNRIRQ